jgi:hypothetical protein
MLVLPVQYLTFSDSLGWSAEAPGSRTYRGQLDDEITYALGERGLRSRWKFAPDVTTAAARNAGFTADPHAIEATEIRAGVKTDEWQLHEPLGSQLRSLVALSDARYVLFPVEVRFTNADSAGKGRAVLHVVVIDARRSQVQWAGDVWGAPTAKFSPAIAADLASRLADLVIGQPQ